MDKKLEYLDALEKEYKYMNRSFCRFVSYKDKLDDMDLTQEDKDKIDTIIDKLKNKYIKRLNRTIERGL